MPRLPDRIPFAVWTPYPEWPTGNYTDTVNYKAVYHKTVGSGASALAWYHKSGGVPKVTVVEDGTVHQHYSMNKHDRGLRNQSGGVQTNLDGAISVEIAGHPGKNVTAAQRKSLTRLSAWFTEIGVPAVWLNGAPVKGSRYRQRLSQNAWDNGSGNCGHVDVPENDHYDPEFTASTLAAVEAGFAGGNEEAVTPRAEWNKIYNHADPDIENGVVGEVQDFLRYAALGPDGKLKTYYGFKSDGKRGEMTDSALQRWKIDTWGNLSATAWLGTTAWNEMNRQLFNVHVQDPAPVPTPPDCAAVEDELRSANERADVAEASLATADNTIDDLESEIQVQDAWILNVKMAVCG